MKSRRVLDFGHTTAHALETVTNYRHFPHGEAVGYGMFVAADLSAGLIDEKTAKERRKALEDESGFFGAMDGASKFVRGDAVAGLLVVFINIIGGMVIGIAQEGLSFADAARSYTLLTVGDGLVTQIPALIVSTAAGLLVSKAAVTGAADKALMKQLSGYPQALGMSAGVMLVLGLLPGIPMLPFVALGGGAAALAWSSRKRQSVAAAAAMAAAASDAAVAPPERGRADLGGAEDRRSEDRTGLCAVAAGQRPGWPGSPHRADQGAAPLARDRDGIRDAGGADSRQRAARGEHLHH